MNNLTEDEIRTRIASKVKKLYTKKKKKYVCEFCGTGFDKRDFLISHMKIRHPDEYEIKYGENQFASLNPDLLHQLESSSVNQGSNIGVPSNPVLTSSPVSTQIQSQGQGQQPASPISGQNAIFGKVAPISRANATNIPTSANSSAIQVGHKNLTSNLGQPPISLNNTDQRAATLSHTTRPPISMAELEKKLTIMDQSLKKTMGVLDQNMKALNKELRYLICEYKSPFIIFD
ncbi:MAG: hypothetical protein ACTSWL_06175 [Promethearchaeota archaeon]